MRIGLIQIDGKMPNLALMKLASWHKEKGDDVKIIDLSTLKIDKWYGSKIFMGGSGYDIKQRLPKDIEEQIPDYDLFNIDYSMGFTSRGCIKDCGFCIVKEKEGDLKECDMDFIKHNKVVLWDNNFLASPKWKDKLQYFIDNDIKVSFNQGLDIGFIDEEKARLLSKVKYYDRNFSRRCIYFAFDNPKLEKMVREKLKILIKYIKPYHIMVYMIVGFDTEFEQDMHRFKVLREYNVDPFVMIYNNRKDKPILRDFARWVNKRIYKVSEFKDYKKVAEIPTTKKKRQGGKNGKEKKETYTVSKNNETKRRKRRIIKNTKEIFKKKKKMTKMKKICFNCKSKLQNIKGYLFCMNCNR